MRKAEWSTRDRLVLELEQSHLDGKAVLALRRESCRNRSAGTRSEFWCRPISAEFCRSTARRSGSSWANFTSKTRLVRFNHPLTQVVLTRLMVRSLLSLQPMHRLIADSFVASRKDQWPVLLGPVRRCPTEAAIMQ